MKLHICEILDKVKAAKDNQEKINIIKTNDSTALRQVLYANFSSRVKFLLPSTPATYKQKNFPVGLGDTSLLKEARRLYLFVEGGHPTLAQLKRELLWVQILEALPKEEADLLEQLKNKNLGKVYNLSKEIVVRLYPEYFTGEDLAVAEAVAEKDKSKVVAPDDQVSTAATEQPVKRKRGRPKKVVA